MVDCRDTNGGRLTQMTSLETLHAHADLSIDIAAEIDRTVLTVRQILELDHDSLVRLSRPAGDTIDVLIGGACIGQGEIVVEGERIAVRLAELREEA